jgi:hypothetical protein
LGKVKEVIAENESLHERQKSGLIKSVFECLHSENDEEDDDDGDTENSEVCKAIFIFIEIFI